MSQFGKNLKKIRQQLHMTATELAERAGITQACLSQIENGSRNPGLDTIVAILAVIPIKFEKLVGKDL